MHYYLIINEGLDNGLIKSQVIAPILYNSLAPEVGVISIEKPWSKVKNKSEIQLKLIPMGIPYRIFLFNNFAFLLVPIIAFLYALFISFIVKRNDTLIARSYFPGIVLYYLKMINGNKYKFDTRSLFIQESVTKGALRKGSFLYKKWLSWEKGILENAELTIAVAQKQAEYYHNVTQNKIKIINIPCYASNTNIQDSEREKYLPFVTDDIVICYYGSLDKGWNNVNSYYDFFEKAINEGYKICIISQNFPDLKKDKRFKKSEIFLVDTRQHINFSDYLQLCDYGVVKMEKVLDWETRLSVKFAEYLSHGLAVIVGEYVGEAVRISREYFEDYNVILKENEISLSLKQLSISDKYKIRVKAEEIFGMKNFVKVLEC